MPSINSVALISFIGSKLKSSIKFSARTAINCRPSLQKLTSLRDQRKNVRERPDKKEEFDRLNDEIKSLWGKYTKIARSFPEVDIAYAVSEGNPHDAQVQRQGDPGIKREKVRRGFLQVLGGQTLPEGFAQSGRRELADWIVDPKNPLTARVMVNRIWHHHFGRGLVRTTSDFGLRGQSPSHPELLDYLARYFMEHDWSVKGMHRLIMRSQAYQRSSQPLAASEAIDPENVFLHRANRRRLSAEEFRDTVLAISGRLDRQPAGSHPFPHKRTFHYRQHEPFQENYQTDKRSIYLLQSRLRKIPFIDLFDGPDGNIPFPERRSTSTPLQSLYLMNAPFIHEQSLAVAEIIIRETESDRSAIDWAYRWLFGRRATDEELVGIQNYLEKASRAIAAADKVNSEVDAEREKDPRRDAWAACVRSMFASNAFLYID